MKLKLKSFQSIFSTESYFLIILFIVGLPGIYFQWKSTSLILFLGFVERPKYQRSCTGWSLYLLLSKSCRIWEESPSSISCYASRNVLGELLTSVLWLFVTRIYFNNRFIKNTKIPFTTITFWWHPPRIYSEFLPFFHFRLELLWKNKITLYKSWSWPANSSKHLYQG